MKCVMASEINEDAHTKGCPNEGVLSVHDDERRTGALDAIAFDKVVIKQWDFGGIINSVIFVSIFF